VPVHTLIVLGAPPLLGDLLTGAVASAADVRVALAPAGTDLGAVLDALASDPEATVVTLEADGRAATVWRLTRSPLAPVSIDALIAAARAEGAT